MKISDIIKELKALQKTEGDLEVVTSYDGKCYDPVSRVDVRSRLITKLVTDRKGTSSQKLVAERCIAFEI